MLELLHPLIYFVHNEHKVTKPQVVHEFQSLSKKDKAKHSTIELCIPPNQINSTCFALNHADITK